MNKKIIAIALSTFLSIQPSFALDSHKKQPKQTLNNAKKHHINLLKELNQGVKDAYKDVIDAMKLLEKEGKEKQVIKKLQQATGKFDTAIAANPNLNQVVISSQVRVNELITTPTLIKETVDTAIDLLKNNQVQAAQNLLLPLKDEMIIQTRYLPIATYPDAVKLATKYLVNGKKQDAIATLKTTLSTIVIKESIVPLALVRAENLIKKAAATNKKEKNLINTLLTGAEIQLENATLMGYTNSDANAYASLSKQIKAIKKEIKGDNAVEKMYKKIKKSFSQLITHKSETDTETSNK